MNCRKSGVLVLILLISYLNLGLTSGKRKIKIFEEADNYYNLKRYEDAAEKYQKVIDTFSDTTNIPQHQIQSNQQFILTYAYYQLGECEFQQNKYSEAIDNYNRSLENDSYKKWEEKNWYRIGLSYFYQEKYLNAIEYFKKTVDGYSDSKNGPMAQYYMAFSYELMRKPDEAKKAFEKFLEMYPGHEWAEKVKGKVK